MNTKWEYMHEQYRWVDGEIEDWLNVRGQKGWECYHIDRKEVEGAYVCYFRREITDYDPKGD